MPWRRDDPSLGQICPTTTETLPSPTISNRASPITLDGALPTVLNGAMRTLDDDEKQQKMGVVAMLVVLEIFG